MLQSASDAPIRGVILSYFLFFFLGAGVCVSMFFFLFRAPFVGPSPPLLPAPVYVPSRPLLSPSPFTLLPPLRPCLPSSRSSLPRLPFPPFLVALLGHALKLPVPTRACCYLLGRAHTFILLLSFLPSHCSRALHSSSSLVTSPAACTFCCFGALLVTSRLLFVWGTHASSYSYACTLPPSILHSSLPCLQPTCPMFFTYFLVGPSSSCTRCRNALMTQATYALYSLYLAMPKIRRVFLMLPCHATYMLIICWFMYSLHLTTPTSRSVFLMLPCHTLSIVVL